MWPHINNSLYEIDFEIKVMRNTCKNHRAGKIWFPSKSNSQVRGCLSPTAITRLDVFSLLLPLTPSPALSARHVLCALLSACLQRGKRFFQAPGCGLEEAGAGWAPAVCAAARYAIAESPPATQERCGGARPACNKHTHTPIPQGTTDTCFTRKSGSQIHS